ncbi:MAG: hypothetical protein IJV14_10900 [Lachnospiraceae bacterium]|nr:hypothetical protein [Lachnospiraceae bacterium]
MRAQCAYKQIGMEMVAKGIDTQLLSEMCGIPYQTLRKRLRGGAGFTLEEAIDIHKVIGQHMTIEQLFQKE